MESFCLIPNRKQSDDLNFKMKTRLQSLIIKSRKLYYQTTIFKRTLVRLKVLIVN